MPSPARRLPTTEARRQHRKNEPRERPRQRAAAAIQQHRCDGQQRGRDAGPNPDDQQQRVLGEHHRAEIAGTVPDSPQQPEFPPPLKDVPHRDRAEADCAQQQPQRTKRLKSGEV